MFLSPPLNPEYEMLAPWAHFRKGVLRPIIIIIIIIIIITNIKLTMYLQLTMYPSTTHQRTGAYTRASTCTHIQTRTRTHAHTHTHAPARTHAHTHTLTVKKMGINISWGGKYCVKKRKIFSLDLKDDRNWVLILDGAGNTV